MIQLSTITPDFEGLVAQLLTELSTKETWRDRLTSATGKTLVDLISSIGAYSQYSIESAFQETFPESAKNSNSQYAAANFLGVRYSRKLPASVRVNLSSLAPTTLPVNSQFSGAGTYWFNREALTLTSTPTLVTLYQGQIVRTQLNGLGTDFQAFVTPERDFVVSDQDVFLTINDISIPAIREGLWTKLNLPGAWHFTLPSGQMILLFGNEIYGSKPKTNDQVVLTYVLTLGADGSNILTMDKTFVLDIDPNIRGVAATQTSGGGSQTNPMVYKNITPALFGSFDASVTASQYKKHPLKYAGVIDGFTLAQREINPRALNWMNVIKVCLLTQTPWSSVDWANFEAWFNQGTMYSPRIFREDPTPAPVAVSAIVRCKNLANLGEVRLNVEAALDRLFAPRQGIIGLDIYRSDIVDAILEADSNVDHVVLRTPTTDLVLRSLAAPAPVLQVLPTGGSLGPGVYDYGLSIVSALGGEAAPANWSTVTITSGTTNRVVLTWEGGQANVAQYRVWGRVTPVPMGLLGSVAGTVLTFTDTGAVVPTGTVPVQSTIATYYPSLTSKSLDVVYTTRDSLY